MNVSMNIPNTCMSEKYKYYVFLNVLKFEEYMVMSNYKYQYDENVELSIYHPTLQSFCLIL